MVWQLLLQVHHRTSAACKKSKGWYSSSCGSAPQSYRTSLSYGITQCYLLPDI